MQQPSSDYSPDLVKETCTNMEPLDREGDLHKENAALSESSSPEDVFSSSEMQTVPVCMDTILPPEDYIFRRGYTEFSPLRLPREDCIEIHHAPYQFNRARISTSPTLRWLSMSSASQVLPFQDCSDTAQISLHFLKTFFETAKKYVSKSYSPMDFSSVLRTFFQGDLCQTQQICCLNYTSAIFYLEKLRQRDFGIYLKWCEQNEQCKRVHLPELLVALLHRLTRYPLLLNIWKRSTNEAEESFIQSLKEKGEKSISNKG
ncbi:hypothetical protein DUI87_20638 [Hirundo rustica rustica]|uniref:DH domain-containing protein n=1 Tax=Hirundo rustica rustica TaxID=333673 RepID=A0A3M0JTB0_HIRRU|nr:hypothetical protein DUI87_20638 [Hirundo rustica rustica]